MSKRDQSFIDGIYNHCDRWCERCPQTSRCQLYAMEPPLFDTPESRDPRHAAFWNALSLCFAQANRRLRDRAAQAGTTVDEAWALPDAVEPDGLDGPVRRDPLVLEAAGYASAVERWFEMHEDALEQHERDLRVAGQLALPGRDASTELATLHDDVETVLWYQHFIEIKTALAVATRLDLERHADPEDEPFARQMMNGAMKIALIAMDRSTDAWRRIRGTVDEPGDDALSLLCRLGRLREAAEQAFPDARSFRRPGFETGPCEPSTLRASGV